MKIKSILKKIEDAGTVRFAYQPNQIDVDKMMSLSIEDLPLENVLGMIFDHSVLFEERGELVVILPANVGIAIMQVSGKVTDANTGEPLPGVNVAVKGTLNGTSTDADGKFSLPVPDQGAVLVFTFVGYLTQEIIIGTQNEIDMALLPDTKTLNEVVVVGYGETKKSDITGSIASIKGDDINAYPATNLMQSLSGRATGVQVSQNSGEPGGAVSVRIRGTNSVMGSNEPLYVVDGFPYSSNPTLLSNSDIESIEVLKDASATAIYGSRGANGVVIITTKRGKPGKTKVDYDGYVGFQTVRKKIDMMNAREYAQFYNEQAANDRVAPHFTQEEINSFGNGTDWQDVVLQTAPVQNHSIAVKGGNEKTKFSVSGSNFNQAGIIKSSNYIRNSLHAALSTDISKKLTFDLNTTLSREAQRRQSSSQGGRGASLFSAMLSGYPTIATNNPDGSYTNLSTAYSWGSNVITNPLNFLEQSKNHAHTNRVLTNGALTYKPIDGLAIKISGGIENNDQRNDMYTTKKFVNSQGSAAVATVQSTSVLNENTVSYAKEIGQHSISAVAGVTYQNYKETGLSTDGSGFISDIQESYDMGAASVQGVPTSYYSEWTLISYLGRVNYSFRDRYLATVSFRADGSSRYSQGQKWGQFPSASIAWRISEESFIKDHIRIISDLKLKAGYGETGSTAIPPYYTLNQLMTGKVVFGDALTTTYSPGSRLAGPLKWETTAQTDFGFTLGLLENRFTFEFDYYIKNTRDLLNIVPLPSALGYTTTVQNIGRVQNKGFEIAANAVVLEGAFKWNIGANLSRNRNNVMKLYDGRDILGERVDISAINDNINIIREGNPIGSFFGYIEKGYDANGKIAYEDLNGNGVRDIGDKRVIGNPLPSFSYGFNSTMSFKNVELNVFIQGSQGNDIFNISSVGQTLDYGQALNMPREVYLNHWTPEKTTAKYPIISRSSGTQVSNRWVEDGSYLRFKNIQLSYAFPLSSLKAKKFINHAQIYISAQNFITFTKYSWYDPEINSYGGSNSIRLGIDHYSYPSAKTVTVGVKLGF
ncbi:MAG: SusC/RagA family TonB-linked outer membrane protein [Candidatus Nephrothrix sp. EaCA]|nr:MAG: SusC/RagA family TonB-linked outer membrane protein [Candidatus Nephrothrix sp. EaCA]